MPFKRWSFQLSDQIPKNGHFKLLNILTNTTDKRGFTCPRSGFSLTAKDKQFIFGIQNGNDDLYRGLENRPSPISSSVYLFLFISQRWSGSAMPPGKHLCRGVLPIWTLGGQGPTAHAIGAVEGCLDICSLVYHFSLLHPWGGAMVLDSRYMEGLWGNVKIYN